MQKPWEDLHIGQELLLLFSQKFPQYCWEFHDNSQELSGTPQPLVFSQK